MKYFITGITGFIGSNLALYLLAEGHEVNGLVRDIKGRNCIDHPNLKLIEGDLHHIKAIREGTKGCRYVFHLAGFVKTWAKTPEVYEKINVEGTYNVFEAAKMNGVEKVIFTSTAATIPPSRGMIPSTEESNWNIPMFNMYEKTKLKAEQMAIDFSKNGLSVVTVNPSRVYGPGPMSPSNSITRMIIGYFEGTWRIIPGNGKRIGSYVFIDDVVRGLVSASEKGRPGERYIFGGENLSFDELFNTLSKITGIRRRMVHLPLPVMITAAKLLELQQHLTGVPPLITASWVRKYLNDWSLSSEKAVHELGYKITPFHKGARKTIEWISEQNNFGQTSHRSAGSSSLHHHRIRNHRTSTEIPNPAM